MSYVLLVIGFALLIKGADFFVDGSSEIAKVFKIPSVIIGLTIVSLGTSLPEAAVSVNAALAGSNELALSNITGSNIFNLMVVAGLCAIIKPIPIQKEILRRDFPVAIIASVAVIIFMLDGVISQIEGGIFLVACLTYIVYLVFEANKAKAVLAGGEIEDDSSKKTSVPKSLIFIAIGIPAIIFGGELVVNNAIVIARTFGMSETIIGLTIVAVGTSLPELMTSLVAARKGENGIALGNAIGSCILNILFILGASAALSPIMVASESFIHVGFMLFTTSLMFIFALSGKTANRIEGIICTLLYVSYIAYLILF